MHKNLFLSKKNNIFKFSTTENTGENFLTFESSNNLLEDLKSHFLKLRKSEEPIKTEIKIEKKKIKVAGDLKRFFKKK